MSGRKIQLVPPPQPICGTEARFCLPHPITLNIKKIYGGDFRITWTETGNLLFISERGLLSRRGKKVLKETSGKAVANLKKKSSFPRHSFDIYTGEDSDLHICNVVAKIRFLFQAKLITSFKDAVSGAQTEVILQGDKGGEWFVIYLGEPMKGGLPIAKLFRPFCLFGKQSYRLEVSAGVDIAFLVILCIAFDEFCD